MEKFRPIKDIRIFELKRKEIIENIKKFQKKSKNYIFYYLKL